MIHKAAERLLLLFHDERFYRKKANVFSLQRILY
jgi:hypothetical protein